MANNPDELPSWQRFDARVLEGFALALLRRGGMPAEQAEATAHVLLEGDLMGHTTHGL